MTSIYSRLITTSATIALIVSCAPAAAQTAEPESDSADIIVTAQKREQRLQDVGIAITAFTGEDVERLGLEDADDVADFTPNVTAVNVFGNNLPNFSIRGVGLNSFAPNNSSPTAVHVDEVYYGYGVMLNFSLFDTERVEILKGPQGTLYGRNTTGGAISYFSRRPTRHFDAGLTVGYGNYQNLEIEGFVNGPIGETVSARLSGTYRRQWSGPYYNRFLNEKHGEVDKRAWRAQVQFDPSDVFSLNVNVHGGRDRSDLAQYNMLPSGTAPGASPFCPQLLDGTLRGGEPNCIGFIGEREPDDDPFTGSPGFRPFLELDALGVAVNASLDLGFATLTSVTGYEDFDRFVAEDADGFPQTIVDDYYENHITQFSQELRLASDGARPVNWLLGAYYLSDEIDSPRFEAKSFFARNFGAIVTSIQETQSLAGFGQLEWQVANTVRLIGGLRYTWEERSFDATTHLTAGNRDLITDAPGTKTTLLATANDTISFNNVSGKIALEFKPDPDQLFYASISQGFKSGGFNGNFAFSDAQFNRFDEETLLAYEVGAKLGLLNRRLFWNTALFYYDYQDLQAVGSFITTVGGAAVNLFVLANLADARTYGFESDLWWRPDDHWDIKAGIGYLDAKFTNPRPGNEALDGNRLTYTPQFSASGLVRYSAPVGSRLAGSIQVDGNYQTHYFTDVGNIPISRVKDRALFNTRIGLGDLDERWELAFWVKNIFDLEYTTYVNNLTSTRRVLKATGYPRTYGVQLRYNF